MTRASLLHILDHVGEISEAEVRELEQLAAAFPYCQTAHVLLAKAAHDRGSMLAGQRLRRAATYATDRELLRQLLEQPASTPVAAQPYPPAPADAPAPASDEAFATAGPAPATVSPVAPETEPVAASQSEAIEPQPAPEADLFAVAPTPEPEPVVFSASPEPLVVDAVAEDDADARTQPEAPAAAKGPASDLVELASDWEANIEAEAPVSEEAEAPATLTASAETAEQAALVEPTAAPEAATDEDVLPPVAPPIRPPVEAGISRFEFGLTEPGPLPQPVYQLPGLDEEAAEVPVLASAPPIVTAPFRADSDLGYALGAGSRLGYDLQLHDDGYTLNLPADAFFEPDALLLAHLAAHRPKPTASSLDLINRFLKAQPRIKTPAGVPLPAEEQTDLSARSTSAGGGLASESLATIMVRQGKIDKAIEIYERLMERQPEKKAYFAAQIQQLQQPSE
ncbi:hypothetical protein [Hymenobacter weizhouensis]|uniref:hypothetical protein n=1 Tax=Hymenobacter sp. YIM 151500-1 TaxID=2987689 RepID=UPI0022262F55|nr:hypothetical protein [Hymenobacter sp. YIM 151500-1]UYZ63929.1 hypothetical protein OIS53_03580 [Hymenobacter sp. YIM 151500-1]